MGCSKERADFIWMEAKGTAEQKAGRHAGESFCTLFFNKTEEMANTKLLHTETGKRQYPGKKNHSIMLSLIHI